MDPNVKTRAYDVWCTKQLHTIGMCTTLNGCAINWMRVQMIKYLRTDLQVNATALFIETAKKRVFKVKYSDQSQ